MDIIEIYLTPDISSYKDTIENILKNLNDEDLQIHFNTSDRSALLKSIHDQTMHRFGRFLISVDGTLFYYNNVIQKVESLSISISPFENKLIGYVNGIIIPTLALCQLFNLSREHELKNIYNEILPYWKYFDREVIEVRESIH